MKNYSTLSRIAVLMLAASCLSACDFLRALAGRPTSEDIAVKRVLVESDRKAKAFEDSLRQVETRRVEDSLAALAYRDSISLAGIMVISVKDVPNISVSQLSYRYYPMVGTFASVENADKLVRTVSAAGYPVFKLEYRNGRTAVSVAPSDSPEEIYKTIGKIRGESFCPKDIWILANE